MHRICILALLWSCSLLAQGTANFQKSPLEIPKNHPYQIDTPYPDQAFNTRPGRLKFTPPNELPQPLGRFRNDSESYCFARSLIDQLNRREIPRTSFWRDLSDDEQSGKTLTIFFIDLLLIATDPLVEQTSMPADVSPERRCRLEQDIAKTHSRRRAEKLIHIFNANRCEGQKIKIPYSREHQQQNASSEKTYEEYERLVDLVQSLPTVMEEDDADTSSVASSTTSSKSSSVSSTYSVTEIEIESDTSTDSSGRFCWATIFGCCDASSERKSSRRHTNLSASKLKHEAFQPKRKETFHEYLLKRRDNPGEWNEAQGADCRNCAANDYFVSLVGYLFPKTGVYVWAEQRDRSQWETYNGTGHDRNIYLRYSGIHYESLIPTHELPHQTVSPSSHKGIWTWCTSPSCSGDAKTCHGPQCQS